MTEERRLSMKENKVETRKTKHAIIYHGRRGYPVIHTASSGKRYTMVRAEGGGTKRLYEGSWYYEEPTRQRGKKTWKRLKL